MSPTPPWRTVAEATPPDGVSFVHGFSGPQASRDGIANFFESGPRRRLRLCRVESAPLRAVVRVHTGHTAIDEKPAGPRSCLALASRFPQRGAGIAPEKLESHVRDAQGRVILWGGGWIAAQLRPAGEVCSPANFTLRTLDDWLVPACFINIFPAPVLL